MNQWRSEAIELAPSFAVGVTANDGRVTLGTFCAEVHASDLALTPEQARAIAALLIQGADKSEGVAP